MNADTNSKPSRITLSNESFQRDVIEGSRQCVVLVFFWAPWCRFCRQLIPQIESLAEQSDGQAVLALADAREMRDKGKELGIRGLPSIFAFRGGERADYILGSPPIEFFEDWLARLIRGEDMERDENGEFQG